MGALFEQRHGNGNLVSLHPLIPNKNASTRHKHLEGSLLDPRRALKTQHAETILATIVIIITIIIITAGPVWMTIVIIIIAGLA